MKARSEAEKAKREAEEDTKIIKRAKLAEHAIFQEEGCTNCEETELIKSDLVCLRCKYTNLLTEYTKTKNLLSDKREDFHDKTTESSLKCIMCNDCGLTFRTDSVFKVHIETMHANESNRQENVKCSHCLKECTD